MRQETSKRIDDIVKHMEPYRVGVDPVHQKVLELCHSKEFCDSIRMPYRAVKYYLILGAVMRYRGLI